jgi:signal transduction histidine kinase
MTGQADNAGMRKGMESGADDYLPKPFGVDQLLASVDARLRKHQSVRAQAERELADLRASISLALPHELLTPLNGIFGFADILISDAPNLQPHEVASMAEAIHDSGKRLHRLIENFLIFAQIQLVSDEQKRELRNGRTLNAQDLIASLAQQRAAQCQRTQDLTLALTPFTPAITPDYLTRIVDELLDNAFKFSAAGSPVRIVTRVQAGQCSLRISDKGRGFKPEQIAQIGAYMQFDRRFYEQQGSGLGLTVAWRLTELHGGTFKITSEPNLGTSVDVTLPAAPQG